MSSTLGDIKIYTTYPHSCSYLEEEEAVTLFIDPQTEIDNNMYSRLSHLGFRRSGPYLYRPNCQSCQACIPTRIPVQRFQASRSQKRCLSRNRDLDWIEVKSIDTDHHYTLYSRYIEHRHADGDMYPPKRDQYQSFLSEQWESTRYFELRKNSRLTAVSVIDCLEDGLSAIYTFFAPDEADRSLGTYAVLRQVQQCQDQQLPYLYLGYWIKNCRKMSYKTAYRPIEMLVNNRWIELG